MAVFIPRPGGIKLLVRATNAPAWPPPTVAPLNADVYYQFDGPTSAPTFAGTFPVGRQVDIPLPADMDRDVIVRAVARGPLGQLATPDWRDTPGLLIQTEREKRKPTIGQIGASTNTAARIGVSKVPRIMNVRRITVANDAAFTTNVKVFYQDINRFKLEMPVLPPYFQLDRTIAGAGTQTVYVKVAHAAQGTPISKKNTYQPALEGLRYSENSDTLTVTFADSTGAGGSSGTFQPYDVGISGYGTGTGIGVSVPIDLGGAIGAALQGDTINITKHPYYAVGDDATDNTAAINAALATGKNIFVPPGKFRHSGTLTKKKGQLLRGAGMTSELRYTGTGIQLQEPEGVLTGVTYGHINMADLKLTCTTTATIAVELVHNYEFTFSNVVIDGGGVGYTTAGVHIKATDANYNSAAIHIDNNCKVILCVGDGVRVSGVSGVAGLWIKHSHIQGNGGWGVRTMVPGPPYPASSNVNIESSILEANGLGQVYSDVSYSLRIVGCHLEHLEGQKNKPHIRLGGIGFAQGLTVESNHIGVVTSDYAIDCTNAGDINGSIQRNTFVGFGTAAIFAATTSKLEVLNEIPTGTVELVVGAAAKSVFHHTSSGIKLYGGASAVQPTFEATGGLVGPVLWASANGTAAAPAFTRLTDTDTGIYFPAPNTLGLTVGGSGRVLIDDALSLLPYGASAGQTGTARLYNLALNGAVSLRAHDTSNSYVLTLPANVGTAGQTFVTDASGNLGWVTAGTVNGSGATPRLAFWSSASGLSNAEGLEWDGPNNALKSPARFWAGATGNPGAASPPFSFGNDPDTGIYRAAANTLGFSVGGNGRALLDDALSLLPYGAGAGQTGTLRLFNLAVNGSVTLRAHDTSAPYALTFPVDDGTPDQVLQGDGSGNLSWATRPPGHGVKFNGASLTYRPAFELYEHYGLQAVDTGFNTELRTFGVMTGQRNLVTDGRAAGVVDLSVGTIASGALNTVTLSSGLHWQVGNGIWIKDAAGGTPAQPHFATVTAIDGTASVLTISPPAAVAVTNAEIRHDDSANLQALIDAFASKTIVLPPKFYTCQRDVILRQSFEGNSYTIQGAGAHCTTILFQHGGNGFVAEYGVQLEGFAIKDMTIAAGLASEPYGGPTPNGNKGSAIDLTGAQVVNWPIISGLRIIGFGRWGIICDNMQGGWLHNNIFRQCGSGAIAIITDDTIWGSAKEPNANSITEYQIDTAPYVATSDITRSDGQMANNSRLLNSATGGFTSDLLGRIVRIVGGGLTGGDLIGVVKAVNSGTQLLLSCTNIAGAVTGKTFTIEKVNIAGIYLERSKHTKIQGGIIQGNWSNSPQNINAIRLGNCGGTLMDNLWVESTGGSGGFDFLLTDCDDTSIRGYRSNADPIGPDNENAAGNIRMIRSYGLEVRQMIAENPTLHLQMDDLSDGVDIDHSKLYSIDALYSQYVPHPDRVVLGDSVSFAADRAQGSSIAGRGTATLFDATFGEQHLLNGHYSDGKAYWTDSKPTDWSIVTGTGRHGTYALVNAQAQTPSNDVGVVFQQSVLIDNNDAPGRWVVGVDAYIENFGATPTAGQQVHIDVVGANGAGSYSGYTIPSVNIRNLPSGRYIRLPIAFDVGTGTNRVFTVRVLATRGPNTPRVRFTNWRAHPGRHVAGSYDQPITEYAGGIWRSHVRMVGLTSAPPAPPAGSLNFYPKVVSGVVKLVTQDAAGIETEIGGAGGGITGTGAANVIAKWTGASAQGNSVMVESGGMIGIQTATPTATLHVNGGGRFAGDLTVDSANGRIWGITGLGAGHTVHFRYGGDSFNEIENTQGGGAIFKAYHGLTVQNAATGGVIGPALTVKTNQADKEGLRVDSPASPTADLAQFRPGGTFKSGISPAGRLKYATSLVSTAAAAGSSGAPPSQVAGYLQVEFPDGTVGLVPFYNVP